MQPQTQSSIEVTATFFSVFGVRKGVLYVVPAL
jgi:hypothetical protein